MLCRTDHISELFKNFSAVDYVISNGFQQATKNIIFVSLSSLPSVRSCFIMNEEVCVSAF